ncbi:sensor histidine kinase [Swingsia samuiensis]|uniref:histidine kinase n=1 Tax=Swingsia samuiensis TaxID=1293412 RepID=A0A4Y6UL88_9PROT|nr:ATP-binding protein [Swingsia samuiensis]QDH17127.1 two-component sensor histidine kinase [Swingsia samuiensis]
MMSQRVAGFHHYNGLPLWFNLVLIAMALSGWCAFFVYKYYNRHRAVFPEQTKIEHLITKEHISIDPFPGSILLVDQWGAVLKANQQALAQFGESIHAVMRHPSVRSVLSATLQDKTNYPAEEQNLAYETTFTLDVPVRRTLHVILKKVRGTESAEASVEACVETCVLVSLSDRSEAQAVDRMRMDFVAHASHELRTPLASLSGFIDALHHGEDGMSPMVRKQFLAVMSQQTDRLKRLIDRLLYLSRVQAHEHQKPQKIVEVSDVMASVLDEIVPRFQEKENVLNFRIDDELYIRADEDEMIQVMLNLVENALRYARKGQEDILTVTVFACKATEDEEQWPMIGGLIIGVEDDGKGIEAHHLPRLTERFYRLNEEDRSQQPGTGLGLSIVRHIIDRHEGRLRIKSVPNKGTRCMVWLPPVKGL